MKGMNKEYLIYQDDGNYRSARMCGTAETLEEAEEFIDEAVEHFFTQVDVDRNSGEAQRLAAALYHSYFIRILPEVQ